MQKLIFLLLIFTTQYNVYAQKETTIQNGNAFIYYKVFGKGTPLLLINGGPGMNSEGFEGIARLLSKNNRVITYDQRGTGKSALPEINESTITLDLMMEDIETIRKDLKIEQWIILGHSFGGMLAAYYAVKKPEHILSLIMSSSGGIDLDLLSFVNDNIQSKLSKQESDSFKYWTAKIASGDTSHHARLQRGMALAPAYVYNRKYILVIAERLTQGNQRINELIWRNMRKINFNCTKDLTGFFKPVLIIQGKNDILKISTAQNIQKAFGNSKLILMENTAHYGWLDNEKEYLSVIQEFLAKNNN